MSKPINWIKLSSRRTDQTTENNLQEMAACLFSRKRRSKVHEQELREELLQSPRIGIENYPSQKLLRLIYLTVIHLLFPTKPMASLESLLRFLMPVLRKKAEIKRT